MTGPVNIILDTDMGPDSDDAGALALLNALADLEEAELLAVVASTTCPWAAPCVSAINTYYGRDQVPVGTLKNNGPSGTTPDWSGTTFNRAIANRFPARYRHGRDVPCATRVLREALSLRTQADVVLVAIGSLTNFANLLRSGPDEHGPYPGDELIRRSVKQLVIMGGRYPKGGPECNFAYDPDAACLLAESFPAPLVFVGSELGELLQTGPRLFEETPRLNPVREAYLLWNAHFIPRFHQGAVTGDKIWPHCSFDQATVLFAVRGCGTLFATRCDQTNVVHDDGSNHWTAGSGAAHGYLELASDATHASREIEDLMVLAPRGSSRNG